MRRNSTEIGARRGRAAIGGIGTWLILTAVAASCGARSPLVDVLDRDSSIVPEDAKIVDVSVPDDGTVTPVSCTPGKLALLPATPVVDFVLDSSGSMADPLDPSGPTSKWDALRNALATALPPVDATTEIGAYIFPTERDSTSCTTNPGASLLPAKNNVSPLLFEMASIDPIGGTPTALAVQYAAADLLGLRTASNARAMVLATDGSPNCNPDLNARTCTCSDPTAKCGILGSDFCLDDVATENAISTYAAQGIPTYVIGILAAEDAQFEKVLDAMAIAGGRPASGPTPYYAVRSSADMNAAVTTIRDSVASCTYLTTSVPDTNGSIVVTLDGVVLAFDPSGTDGWEWADEANGEILLSGAACAQAASEASPALFAEVRCGDDDAASDAPASDGAGESGG